ncbi:glycoside hydrolase family 9 protein [Glaciecola sp. MH2013]|nr:glycoside hydrolase family 9 protein [Glaciecola sp. MH2013]
MNIAATATSKLRLIKTSANTSVKTSVKCALLGAAVMLGACGGSGGSDPGIVSDPPPPSTPAPAPTPNDSQELIKLNQIGFLPNAVKIAAVPATEATSFELVNNANDTVVLTGELSAEQSWPVSSTSVKLADFSSVTSAGEYTLRVEGIANNASVSIGESVYLNVHDAALKAYYFNRASTELESTHAGQWARLAGHPDTNVQVHVSAADTNRPAGTVISSPKGWYDAGDYNKYIVNSGISTYTLMQAYEQFPAFYADRDVNIPESGNDIPDILEEIKWNLDWMASMQDPNDGGVYHKLTTLGFSGTVMPHETTAQRYVVQKGTSATLNFAAVMASASRIYAALPEFEDDAAAWRSAAIRAWDWAQANPNVAYQQPSDVNTGEYGDGFFDDERLWAAAELFLLTRQPSYLTSFKAMTASAGPGVPAWPATATLGYISMLSAGEPLLTSEDYNSFQNSFLGLANTIVDQTENSAYGVAMEQADFVWGSNSVALNKSMVLMNAFELTGNQAYEDAAVALVDYVLGRNPTDFSFVTGYGEKTPLDPHHRPSFADDVPEPVPGFVAGGPQPGQQDGCNYPSSRPALSYLDDWCSYSTNEVTINWNAPLVYSLAALHNKQ